MSTPPAETANNPAMPSEFELGWRDRAIALATLGAAALARDGFERHRTGGLSVLEMQVLASLAVLGDLGVTDEGPDIGSLGTALRCDGDLLVRTLDDLAMRGLLVYRPVDEDAPQPGVLHLTSRGVDRLAWWLQSVRPLFTGWPPDRPDVDDTAD